MQFERDWLMRQIAMLCQTIRAAATGKRADARESAGEGVVTSGEELRDRLMELVDEGRACEAEDLLFERAETGGIDILLFGAEFYDRLNLFSDEKLAAMDFSREEIMSGLEDLSRVYGVEGLLDLD